MSIGSIIRKVLKAGYYVVTYDDMMYASSEGDALRIVDSLDKAGRDAVVYIYRDGVFRRCKIVDFERFVPREGG